MNMSELCEICERDTSYGSGLFINRINSDEGYICQECMDDFEKEKAEEGGEV